MMRGDAGLTLSNSLNVPRPLTMRAPHGGVAMFRLPAVIDHRDFYRNCTAENPEVPSDLRQP